MENNMIKTNTASNETAARSHAVNPALVTYPNFKSIMDAFIKKIISCTDDLLDNSAAGRKNCGYSIYNHFICLASYCKVKCNSIFNNLAVAYMEAISANTIMFYPEGNIIYGIAEGTIKPEDIPVDEYLRIVKLVDDETKKIAHIDMSDVEMFYYDNLYNADNK